MTQLQAALDDVRDSNEAVEEFSRGITTDVTQVEVAGQRAEAMELSERRPPLRRPEDAQAEEIVLRRSTGPGRGEARFRGTEAWHLADLMLMAWAPKRGAVSVEFSIRFGDGQAYVGAIDLPANRRRHNLSTHCRRLDTFRRGFCPDLTEKQSAALYRVFLHCYQIGGRADA